MANTIHYRNMAIGHITTFGPLFWPLFIVPRFSQAWVVGKD